MQCFSSPRVPLLLICSACACLAACSGNAFLPANGSTETPTSTASVDSLPTPPLNGNTIDQVPPGTAACPKPANANDYFGTPRCCNTNAIVCDDFEAQTAGSNPNKAFWTVQLNDNTKDILEVSTAQAARGSQSLHINVPNVNGERAVIVNTSIFPAPQQTYFGRAFIYFNSSLPNNHTTYIAAGPNPDSQYEWIRYSTFGNGDLGANDSGPDTSNISQVQLPTKQWTCLEWQFDAQTQTANYWMNGAQILSFNIPTANINFGQTFIGWEIYTQDGTQTNWDLYYDEIALGYSRIGCAN